MLVEDNNEKLFLYSRDTIGLIGLDEFDEKVLKVTGPVLVLCMRHDLEFQEQIRVVEDIYRTCGERVKVYLLEEKALRPFMERFAVKGTPTFLLFMNGSEKGRILGWVETKDLSDFLSRMLQL